MNDFEKLRILLLQFGVGHDVREDKWHAYIQCDEGMRKVKGYDGFSTVFVFDENGKFDYMGAYE